MLRVAQGVVGLAGCYLLALGATAAVRPWRAKRFLEAHASTLQAHVLELALRVVVGVAMVVAAAGMRGAILARGGGWILVATTLVLAVTPWRLHQRFAAWSVPMATRSMPLVAVGALAGGVAVLTALILGPRLP
jgi:hypothetical protein